jgi:RNA polymerase sigma factor for flagellar operon FliA
LADLQSDIQIKLLEDDYWVLRRWDRRASLKTYLGTVVYNVWHDRIRSEKGKIRVSKAARRLGPPAPELEMLLREGLTLDEAYQVLKPRFPGLSHSEAEAIAGQINPRPGPIFVSEDVAARLRARGPTGYKRLERLEKLAKKSKALALMHQILSELPEEDRLLLLRAHAEGVKFSRIAKSQGIAQRPLYGRNERLLKKLRTDLEEAGIRWEDLSDVLGIDESSETGVPRLHRRYDPPAPKLKKRRALALMDQILSELPEQDRLLFHARADRETFSSIARSQGIDAKSLYRRYEKLLEKLSIDLEEAGFRWDDLRETGSSEVTPDDLAVFLEGSLPEEERAEMVQYLNQDEDSFERYIGTARLLDAMEEEEASALSGREA